MKLSILATSIQLLDLLVGTWKGDGRDKLISGNLYEIEAPVNRDGGNRVRHDYWNDSTGFFLQSAIQSIKLQLLNRVYVLKVIAQIPCYDSGVSCNLQTCTQEMHDNLHDP